jgi:hypothetical protein
MANTGPYREDQRGKLDYKYPFQTYNLPEDYIHDESGYVSEKEPDSESMFRYGTNIYDLIGNYVGIYMSDILQYGHSDFNPTSEDLARDIQIWLGIELGNDWELFLEKGGYSGQDYDMPQDYGITLTKSF